MKRKEESGKLRKVVVGFRWRKNQKKIRKKKKMGGGPGRPSGENRGRRRENGKNGTLASVLLGEEKKKEKCGRRSGKS